MSLPPADLPAAVLDGRPIAWLLRHADRPSLPEGEPGDEIGLTPEGAVRARALGVSVRGHLRELRTSPVRRCRETAALIREGAGSDLPLHDDEMLGAPGVFVEDPRRAWEGWVELGNDGMIEHLMRTGERLPGLVEPATAARRLVGHLLRALEGGPGVYLFVTHDSILAPAVSRWLGRPLERALWPDFLDGAFVWNDAGRVMVRYRNAVEEIRWPIPRS